MNREALHHLRSTILDSMSFVLVYAPDNSERLRGKLFAFPEREAAEHIRAAIGAYDVQAIDTLIGDINPPALLMQTQIDRKIAEEQRRPTRCRKPHKNSANNSCAKPRSPISSSRS